MSKQAQTISPVSIDLGAANTGVYFTHYKAGATPADVGKNAKGKVYQLSKDGYTLLTANRTAARHQRRGYDRRQMAKRLFKLIWTKHFNLPWGEDIEKTVGFLMNRRGFSFLTEEYNGEVLNQFPQEVFDLLPDDAKKILQADGAQDGDNAIAARISELAEDGSRELKKAVEAIEKMVKQIRNGLVVIGEAKKLADFCNAHLAGTAGGGKKKKQELKVSGWILREWRKDGLCVLEDRPLQAKQANIGDIIRNFEARQTQALAQSAQAFLEKNAERKEKLKREVWSFAKTFSLEKAQDVFSKPDKKGEWQKAHLHHLFFALQKTVAELEGGARYRRRYFEEIKTVLRDPKHKHGYLKRFCGALHGGKFSRLDEKTLAFLLGHIGNLELKPLRKYFNSPAHKKGDFWDEERLSEYAQRWMFTEWRVGEKDKLKQKGGAGDYAKLRELWKQRQGGIVDFWLATSPVFTIPPYQNNNNRRPPKCQSLVLNPDFLDKKYPDWKLWLKALKSCKSAEAYLQGYRKALKEIKSGKGDEYSLVAEARELQFLFDRVKDEDPLNLNEIYSWTKKLRQMHESGNKSNKAKDALKKALGESNLPSNLKSEWDCASNAVFAEKTFLHLVCQYYKKRQRARDGRIFIHPQYRYAANDEDGYYVNTGRFDNAEELLIYCNRKPRQKRHQLLADFANLFRVFFQDFAVSKKAGNSGYEGADAISLLVAKWKKESEESDAQESNGESKKLADKQNEKLEKWLSQFQTKATASEAAKAQKSYRNQLKDEIDDGGLARLCAKANEKFVEMAVSLYGNNSRKNWEKNAHNNPARAIYFFAQIDNLVYKERSGFSSTCHICSADNAQRMQSDETAGAKAQRLPAIKTRLIDGAVRRMARIVGGKIASEKWKDIEGDLLAGESVCVPIITESNVFEFEPSKEEIVKGQRAQGKPRKGKALKREDEKEALKVYKAKEERIKMAGGGICPYCGNHINGDGEIDHIIPRASKEWGTINDEANLIYAHRDCNQQKGNAEYSIARLSEQYRQKVFAGIGDIAGWIVEQIGDGNGNEFTFGKYHNFGNLPNDNAQKAFRHALFLPDSAANGLRRKVLRAISGRNRALVNGTQRYFAEEIANELYKLRKRFLHSPKAGGKKIGELSFDYFGVSTDDLLDGVYAVRKRLESHSDDPEFESNRKEPGKKQTLYSHLIDAQIAFIIALSRHFNDGSLKVEASEINIGNVKYTDGDGEICDMYGAMKVLPKKFESLPLSRRLPEADQYGMEGKNKPHRPFHRPLFNQNAIAMRFLDLIEVKFPDQKPLYYTGFADLAQLRQCFGSCSYDDAKSKVWLEKNYGYAKAVSQKKNLVEMKNVYSSFFDKDKNDGTVLLANYGNARVYVKVYSLHRESVYKFLLQNLNTAIGADNISPKAMGILEVLRKLWYFTNKEAVLDKDGKFVSPEGSKLKCARVVNPKLKKAWEAFGQYYGEECVGCAHDEIRQKVEDYFLKDKNGVRKHSHAHQQVRKVFSLPLSEKSPRFLIATKNWRGETVYYCRPASNDFSQTALFCKESNGEKQLDKGERLLSVYRKPNMFYIAKNSLALKALLRPVKQDGAEAISPNRFYVAEMSEIDEEFRPYLTKVKNRRTDAARPHCIFCLDPNKRMGFWVYQRFINEYPFRKWKGVLRENRGHLEGIDNPQELEERISEIESMENKPKDVLPALREFQNYWMASQDGRVLAYQVDRDMFSITKK